MATGTPEDVAKVTQSVTAGYLQDLPLLSKATSVA